MGNSSFKEEHTEEETVGLTKEHDGQDEEEANADSSTKTEETQPTEGTSSDLQTSWNILNLIQGMGTLGIPYAIKVGGLFCIVIIVLIAIVTSYTGGLIISAQYDDVEDEEDGEREGSDKEGSKRVKSRSGYAAIGNAVWPLFGSRIVSSVQLIHFFGACILYLILVANFLQGIFPRVLLTEYQCMILAGVLVFPTAFLSNMSNIAWLSLTSIASMNLVFISLICYSLANIREWKFTTLPVASVRGSAIGSCIILFSYLAHPYLPKIEGSMKSPKHFRVVASFAFMIATATKIVFGLALACHYGDKTKQRITNNIATPGFKYATDACLALSGLFSFCMPANLIMNIIQRSNVHLFEKLFPLLRLKNQMSWGERGIDLSMRVVLVFMSTLVAIFLPEFSLLMAIYGSVTAVCLVIIFPIHFYSTLKRGSLSKLRLVINYCIMGVFICVGGVGFGYSMQALIAALKSSQT